MPECEGSVLQEDIQKKYISIYMFHKSNYNNRYNREGTVGVGDGDKRFV